MVSFFYFFVKKYIFLLIVPSEEVLKTLKNASDNILQISKRSDTV
jgi:hypothetical protein